jgi:hypothetical protein
MGAQSVVPTTPTIDQKQVAEMNLSVQQLVAQAQDCSVADNDDYIVSGILLDKLAAKEKSVNDFFDQPARAAYSLHKWITSLRGAGVSPLQRASELLRTRRKEFRADVERQRLEKEAAERQKAKDEQESAALDHAAQLEAAGESEAANFVLERAANAPAPTVVVASDIPKEAGHSIRRTWKFRITDASLIKREFLMPDETNINAMVKRLGPDAVAIIGGIEVYPDEIESVRRKNEH